MLMLGDVKSRPRALLAMDLAHFNQALALRGEGRVDDVLGPDVLENQEAVIDYGSSSLFLKRWGQNLNKYSPGSGQAQNIT
jgi:hypothetical protein